MKRRTFLLAAGAFVAPRVQAQLAAMVTRVAYLSQGTAEAEVPYRRAMDEGFRALGWIEGRNLLIEERYAETRTEDLPRLVTDLLNHKPDVIVCAGPAAAMALKNAGVEIPIVFIAVWDPIGLGLARSLARPEGNFTGLATAVPEGLWGKELDLLREIVPRASRLATPHEPRKSHSRPWTRTPLADGQRAGVQRHGTSGDDARGVGKGISRGDPAEGRRDVCRR